VARVHFAHFAAFSRARWTLCAYSVHFAHLAKFGMAKWTKFTLAAANPQPPYPAPLTFVKHFRRP
jgi:hypothetical protein